MSLVRLVALVVVVGASGMGCGDGETVIPKGGFTEEEKKAIQAEDAQVAEQESQGKKK